MADQILTVEDDDRIRTAIRVALEDEGFSVREAESAEVALDLIATAPPDLVLLDVRLPGMNGFELVRRIRADYSLPIVMVSALSDSHDIVAGLEAGADDYVTKPFVLKELSARVRANLRRANTMAPSDDGIARTEPIRFGDIELRHDEAVVLRGGEPISLTKTEFNLLSELAVHAGIVLSREKLLERVWGYDYFGDTRLVDAHIRRLRTKVEKDPGEPEIILTVRGLGYKLER
ncbi:MAG: response regulator transcription factor [Acidimicrobiia bacterium]|nr:response regulator transcription factor [Acidimicrobiia bacterium]